MTDIFGLDVPFAAHSGIEAIEVADGHTRLRTVPAPHHINNFGVAHGGLVCTLLDIALASAACVQLGRPVMTVDLQVAFVGPGRGVLTAEGWVIRAGRRIIFGEGEVRGPDGSLVAKATGVFTPGQEPTGGTASS